jgi:hypothetical protein
MAGRAEGNRGGFGSLRLLGYFWLEFEEATLVSMEYDVQHVEGSGGDISVVLFCDHPNTSVVGRSGGVDFYFGPGGGACHARIELGLSTQNGSYESNVTVTASSAPLPIVPSLAVEIIDHQGDGNGYDLDRPSDVGVDANGNVFVTSAGSVSAFQITPGGAISVIDELGSLDVNALAVDASGDVYITRSWSGVVTKITPGAGSTDIIDQAGDGAGNWLVNPVDATTDAAGNVYVVGEWSNNAFKITPEGVITQILDASGDGAGHVCDLPQRMALDPEGNLYVACYESINVLQVSPGGAVKELMDERGDGAENPIRGPHGVAYGGGRLYVTGMWTHNAYRIDLAKQVPLPWGAALALAAWILATSRRRLARGASAG